MERTQSMKDNQVKVQRYESTQQLPDFAESLFEVANTGFDRHSPWTVEQIKDTLDTESTLIFYATINQQVVGFIMTSLTIDMVDVFMVVVSIEFKKQSIGTKMFEALISYCEQEKISEIILETRITNIPAIALYERVGFQKVGLRKAYYSSPIEDAIIMKREIGEEMNGC